MVIPKTIGNSLLSNEDLTTIGEIIAATPNTRAIFAMFEPITLPIAKPGLLSTEARIATKISGADVPNPKTTTPIIKGEIDKCFETLAAPSIKRSELQTSKIKPIIKRAEGSKRVVMFYICLYLKNGIIMLFLKKILYKNRGKQWKMF